MNIIAIPMNYRGTRFRSTLEADWAATFDWYEIYWEYEPIAITLSDGTQYRPDFYLPECHIWCEVKGPLDERIEKPRLLNRDLWSDDWLEREPFVVVLRPAGPGDRATWESCNPSMAIFIYRCPHCEHYSFIDGNGYFECRLVNCRAQLERWDVRQTASGEGPFRRAPKDHAATRAATLATKGS